jgi:predicted phage-related endonuclease
MRIKGLELTPTRNQSRKDWLLKRQSGLGGSDMSVIFDLNKRFSKVELFYQKLGLNFSGMEGHNNYTFWGTYLEDPLRNFAQYLDLDSDDPESYIKNFAAGNIINKIDEFPYMVRNKDYPWLLGNTDGLIGYDKVKRRATKIAEIKTISRQSADMWELRFPEYYRHQVHHYMLCFAPMTTELDAIIYLLEDGREFRAVHIPYDPDLGAELLQRSYDFWETLEVGKHIILNASNEEQMRMGLMEVEPEADDSKAYQDFVSQHMIKKEDFVTMIGEPEDFALGMEYIQTAETAKKFATKKQLLGNEIRRSMRHKEVNVLNYGDNGKITFNKRLYVNLK